MSLFAHMKHYYAWANRYRGTKSKPLGCLLLAAPANVAYAATWCVGYAVTGYACWWVVMAFYLLTVLKMGWMFWWGTNSDDWRYPDKMAARWRRNGKIGFGILGLPFLGSKMEAMGEVYRQNFTSMKEDKEACEHAEGAALAPLEMESTSIHIAIVILFYLLRTL